MPTQGLFTRQDAKAQPKPKTPYGALTAERCWELGERGVSSMNPRARHPHMSPTGSDRPDVLILGEAPGETEDARGEQFVGKSGEVIRAEVPRGARVRWDNVCRTRPVDGKGADRPPAFHEIECYRPSLIADVERTKPKIILGLGKVPLDWMWGSGFNITASRGRRFPVRIGEHECWYYCAHHPSWILRVRDQQGGAKSVPGEEHVLDFKNDVGQAFRDLEHLPPPRPVRPEDVFADVVCTHDPGYIKKWFERAADEGGTKGYDYETNAQSPYSGRCKVLSAAFAAHDRPTLAFPINHPGAKWRSGADHSAAVKALEKFMLSGACRLVSHGAFDLEISAHLFGYKVLRNRPNHCTMAQAYCLDERKNGFSLDFLTAQYFGFRIKAASDVDRRSLEQAPIDEVLQYNGGDAKWDLALYDLQRTVLKARGQLPGYLEYVDKVPSIVMAQAEGLPVAKATVGQFQEELNHKAERAAAKFAADPDVARYVKRYGELNPASPKQLTAFFRDFMRRDEGVRGNTYSTDESVLEQLSDLPSARLLLTHRKWTKFRGTYVDKLAPGTAGSCLFPDGRLHANFNYVSTDTGRLCVAADTVLETNRGAFAISDPAFDPTLQNFTIRTHAGRWKKITAKWFKGFERMLRVEFDTGAFVECTAGHRLYTGAGWVKAGSLRPGDATAADPSFAGRGGASVSAQDLSGEWSDRAGAARVVRGRVLPAAGDAEREAGEVDRALVQASVADEGVVSASVWSGDEGGRQTELRRHQAGERARTEGPAQVPGQPGCFGGHGSPRLVELEDRQKAGPGGVPGVCCRKAPQDLQRERLAATVLVANQERADGPRGGHPWVPGAVAEEELLRGPQSGRDDVLANLCQARDAGEAGATPRKKDSWEHQGSGEEGPEGLLVDEVGGAPGDAGPARARGRLCQGVVFSEGDDGRFYGAVDEAGNRGRWWTPPNGERHREGQAAGLDPDANGLLGVSSSGVEGCSEGGVAGRRGFPVARVTAVREVGVQAVWDISVEADRSYVAQGLVHHNSIDDPSLQNFPTRTDEGRRIRQTVAPGERMVVMAVDEAQLEYRGYAMYTRDKVLVDSCWTGYDVHMHWAKRIREAHPPAYEAYLEAADGDDKKGMKAFRSRMKSLWVFAALYKAGWRSRALNIGLPDEVAQDLDRELWQMLAGVRKWHNETIEFYRQHRYVKYLNGRRRHGPMNTNQIVNAPVQGYCSDIVCNAWNRLNRIALETDRPWLSPTLNLHDDLSFFWLPESKVAEALPVVVKEMVLCPFEPAQVVPLGVEVKVGPTWGDLVEVGAYSSHKDIPGYKHYTEAR